MPKITIDNRVVEVEEGSTLLQAAEQLGIEIPVFCYHDRLSIAGNCRMCLVAVENSPKLVASCAMPASEGMVVHTNTPAVQKARKGTLEFLLMNHPLDCPICDQGGECDLQDITIAYGADYSRYQFPKRAVIDKNMGPLIKTAMNRCIHCTRCVRFCTEIAGVPELGTQGRGEHMEITSYLEKALTSELSGNLIDLCPVGALTSKPFAFKGRTWEMNHTESIDVMDAVGSSIRIDTKDNTVMRILPRLNEAVNQEWISDKTRFACDGLKVQRLDRCYGRDQEGFLKPISWEEALQTIAHHLKGLPGEKIAALAGDVVDAEAMVTLKDLMAQLNAGAVDCRQDGAFVGPCRGSYIFNTTLQGLEQTDFCLLIGTNPRHEAPLVNVRLRSAYVAKGLPVFALGPQVDLTYPATFLGDSLNILEQIQSPNHPIHQHMTQAQYPIVILGQGALSGPDGACILAAAQKLALATGALRQDWNGFNILQRAASRVAGLDLGLYGTKTGPEIITACQNGEYSTLFLLGADEISTSCLDKTFVIYQGHHGDKAAQIADIILPSAAYTEKDGIYTNTEGRIQRAYRACSPLGEALVDWQVLKNLSDVLAQWDVIKTPLPYTTQAMVRKRLEEVNSVFKNHDTVTPVSWHHMSDVFGRVGPILKTPFVYPVENFYMTDVISRHSATMAHCTQTQESHHVG